MSPSRPSRPSGTLTVVVHSEDPAVRDRVRTAVGRRPAPELGRIEWVEAVLGDDVIRAVDAGGVDLCVLDGESGPTGGMGLSRQLKNEIRDCPPCLVLVGRRDDRWLATWSQADAVLTHPVDAVEAVAEVTRLLRRRAGLLPAGEGGTAR